MRGEHVAVMGRCKNVQEKCMGEDRNSQSKHRRNKSYNFQNMGRGDGKVVTTCK